MSRQTTGSNISNCSKISKAVKSQDMFAVPVQLTYRGERAFNTRCGGCISIIIGFGLMIYFACEFNREFNHP